MLRQDIERYCLSHCHPLEETDLRLLILIKSYNKLHLKRRELNPLSSFKQAVRLYLIDKLVSEYNSDFLCY